MMNNTNTNARAVYPLEVEAPPTHNDHHGASHAPPPPPQNEKCCQCIAGVIAIIFCVSLISIPCVLAILLFPYDLLKIRVDSVSASSFTVDSAMNAVTSNWNIGFNVEEKNGRIVREEPEPTVSVFYKEVKLSSMPLHGYSSDGVYLMVTNSTGTSSVPVTEQVAKAIAVDRSNGVVNLTITIHCFFRVMLRGEITEIYGSMMVRCENVKVGFSHHNATTGTMLGESRKCRVY